MDDVKPLHESLRVKYPVDNQGDYAGALLKVSHSRALVRPVMSLSPADLRRDHL